MCKLRGISSVLTDTLLCLHFIIYITTNLEEIKYDRMEWNEQRQDKKEDEHKERHLRYKEQ